MSQLLEPRSVALVSAVVPGVRDSGKKVVLGGLLDYWCDRVGPANVHYVFLGHPDTELPSTPYPVHRLQKARLGEQLASVAWRTLATRRHTLQESLLYARRTRDELRDLLTRIGADVEILDTVRTEQYAEHIPARPGVQRVVYLDDLFSVRYARMLEVMTDHPEIEIDPLGEFRSHIPAAVGRLVAQRRVQRLLLDVERRLVARREVEIARRHELSLLVNPAEAASLRAIAGVEGVRELRPMVAEPAVERAYAGRPEFVLLGLLSLPHNHDAALSFLTSSMPGVLEQVPDARVHVVGRSARPELLAAAEPFGDNVVMSGFVPDLDGLLAGACAVLAPVRFGSGIKIKILEALAHGVPVLGTTCAVEGIRSGADSGLVVEDDLARFPERMRDLTDPATNLELSRSARRHHDSTYSRAAVFAEYDELFGRASRAATSPRTD